MMMCQDEPPISSNLWNMAEFWQHRTISILKISIQWHWRRQSIHIFWLLLVLLPVLSSSSSNLNTECTLNIWFAPTVTITPAAAVCSTPWHIVGERILVNNRLPRRCQCQQTFSTRQRRRQRWLVCRCVVQLYTISYRHIIVWRWHSSKQFPKCSYRCNYMWTFFEWKILTMTFACHRKTAVHICILATVAWVHVCSKGPDERGGGDRYRVEFVQISFWNLKVSNWI